VRIAGLDIGTKVTGMALSDEMKMLASPKRNITGYRNMDELAGMLEKEISGLSLESIVIGNPIHMNGDESLFFKEIKTLGDRLNEKTGIPVVYWDERLSTSAVEKSMLEGDLSRRKRKKIINSAAAQWILQGYLDYCGQKIR
jgi:putative holliday junction resolvase